MMRSEVVVTTSLTFRRTSQPSRFFSFRQFALFNLWEGAASCVWLKTPLTHLEGGPYPTQMPAPVFYFFHSPPSPSYTRFYRSSGWCWVSSAPVSVGGVSAEVLRPHNCSFSLDEEVPPTEVLLGRCPHPSCQLSKALGEDFGVRHNSWLSECTEDVFWVEASPPCCWG